MIALRNRNFRLYWLGQAVSNTGNWMQVVALGWFILQINSSPLALGLLGLAQSVPFFMFSLPGGMLADRFTRLNVLIVTQTALMVLAIALALLVLIGKPPLWSLLLVATLAAMVTAIDNPARQAFLSDLVPKEMLLNAIALNASVYNGAAVIGPSLAGILLLSIGAAGCFLLNAISFLAVLAALLIIRGRTEDNVQIEAKASAVLPQRPLRLLTFTPLRHEYAILAVLVVAAAASLLGRPYLTLMPAFARLVQHVGPAGLGLMVAASGLGSLIGSILLASLRTPKRLEGLLIICGACFSLALATFALVSSLLPTLLILVFCGAGATMTMATANTLLQMKAPAHVRGRVMSLYTLIAAGFTPLGALLITGLGTAISLAGATVAGALGIMVIIAGYRLLLSSTIIADQHV
jgi:MFS family permease